MISKSEDWKDIPSFEGRYQVSDMGNVRSLDRLCWNGSTPYFRKGKNIKPSLNNKGYYSVNLWSTELNKGVVYRIHSLVAIAFLNYEKCGMAYVVDHVNNNKLDNRLSNLQVTSQRVNSSKDKKGSSQYTGVSFDNSRNRWISAIHFNNKRISLGRHECELKAAYLYNQKLKEINNERVF